MTFTRIRLTAAGAAIIAALALAAAPLPAGAAEDAPHAMPGGSDHAAGGHAMTPEMMQEHQRMTEMHHAAAGPAGTPTAPGQGAFGAIQEIVRILEADPATDWSKVRLEALRQHLIDMNAVTLDAAVAETPIDGGLRIAVTGQGRTLAAIRRMVPAHAHELNRMAGWQARTVPLPDGVQLTVTAADPGQAAHIRGLGFIGLLVSGSHHQIHHLAMARGEFAH